MIPVCPKCHVPLFLVVEDEIEVDYCPKCRGVWLDAGELEALAARTGTETKLLQAALDATIAKGEKSQSLCPRCDQWLLEFTPNGSGPSPGHKLLLERCPRGHGFWFDAGELERLLLSVADGQTAHAVPVFLAKIFGAPRETGTI